MNIHIWLIIISLSHRLIVVGRCLRHLRCLTILLSFELCVYSVTYTVHYNFDTLYLLWIECRNMFKNNHPSMHQMPNETKQKRPICYYISFGLYSVFGGICISYLHLTRYCFHCIATVDRRYNALCSSPDLRHLHSNPRNPKMHIVSVIVFMVIFHFENAMSRWLFHIKIFSSKNRFVYSSKCVWIVWLLNNNNNQAQSTQNTVFSPSSIHHSAFSINLYSLAWNESRSNEALFDWSSTSMMNDDARFRCYRSSKDRKRKWGQM